MKKRLSNLIAVMAGVLLFMAAVSCVLDFKTPGTEGNTETVVTGKISGKVQYSNVEGNNHGGIIVTLDKTDGLSTRAVIQSVSSRSISSARSVVASNVSSADGSYLFENLEPGTYTVYAASSYSSERAVCTNVVVRAAETTVAAALKLTATGSISGKITIDKASTGNTGFLVFVAGTSYMAMTDDAGNYTISGVPAGEGYQLVAAKNGKTFSINTSVSVNADTSTKIFANIAGSQLENTVTGVKGDTGDKGADGISIVWLGSFTSSDEIQEPSYLNAFFNTTDGCSYVYNGEEWTFLAKSGTNGTNGSDGKSILWKGESLSAPENPELNWAYYDITDKCSYIYDGSSWTLLAKSGTDGTNGTNGVDGNDGKSIIWKGELLSAPENPELNWAYYNTTDKCSYIYDGNSWTLLAKSGTDGTNGIDGNDGNDGKSIIWKGELSAAPSNPELNWGYYNITDGCSYIYNGSRWTLLAKSGIDGNDGCDGKSIIWKGELLRAPVNPELNWAYYNTLDGCSYIYDGEEWNLLAKGSEDSRSGAIVNSTKLTGWDNPKGEIIIPKGVTSIEWGAFKDCSEITSITIPDSVTSIGSYAFDDCSALISITIPDSVTSIESHTFDGCNSLTSITLPDSITSIGDYAFDYCSGLTSITLSDNVTSIGNSAFRDCIELMSITIPDSVTSIGSYAFENCSGLASVTLSDSITSIESYAFKGCSALTSITIPDSVTSIESHTFDGCSGLTNITFSDSLTSIKSYAFESCSGLTSITFPDSVTSIESYAFDGCSGLTSITIPDGVTSIGSFAFSGCRSLTSITIPATLTSIDFCGCTGLTSITIPDTVTRIGNNAFYGCSGLTSVIIPDSVTTIGMYAFEACRGLTSITIPDSVTSIGSYAFRYCSSLTSITIPDSITTIKSYAFSGFTGLTNIIIPDSVTSIGGSAFSGCSGLTSITIPDSVTSIGGSAFSGCSGLTSITIPNSVTSIGFCAFEGCSGLTGITISDGVTSIEDHSFEDCSSLTNITIPDSVTSIGTFAFSGCSGLTSITIPDTVTSFGFCAFEGCTSLTTVNYCGSAEQWQSIRGLLNSYLTGATINYNYTGN